MQPKEQKLQLLSALAAEFNRQNITWAVGASLLLCMVFVAAGEAVSCMLLGPILLRAVRRIPSRMLHS